MTPPAHIADNLMDRTWNPARRGFAGGRHHPFQPKRSMRHRLGMLGLFLVLSGLIGGYWYITNPTRIETMAERYLSGLIGGPVEIGGATLSLFQGLRLDEVVLKVDNSDHPDSTIFTADTLLVRYSPSKLLAGKIEATEIVAINPQVRLVEDIDSGQWNYQRLSRRGENQSNGEGLSVSMPRPRLLPEIVLRSGRVVYAEMREGVKREQGHMTLEGQLTPVRDVSGAYRFVLQSRGQSALAGPSVSGRVIPGTGRIIASARNFTFGRDVKSMLPHEVRRFLERMNLSGRLDVPEMFWNPSQGDGQTDFRVVIELQGVTLAIPPEHWTDPSQPLTTRPAPIRLQKVNGTFVFTRDAIEIHSVTGYVESNGFKLDGRIEGYSPSSAATIHIASLDSEHIFIPAAPAWADAMPPAVREIYDRFRPQGTARLKLTLRRPQAGARPQVTGVVEILKGNFIFEKFLYPLRDVTGRIVLGTDEQGVEQLRIEGLRGYGIKGGPNETSIVSIDGTIGPFGDGSAVNVIVSGRDIHSEPVLRKAFEPDVQQALAFFDAPGRGELPLFYGDFTTHIVRPPGHGVRWSFDTDIILKGGTGAIQAFAYPLRDITGELRIRTGRVEIVNASMRRGDMSLRVDGQVHWSDQTRQEGQPSIRPDLTITARNLPIDADLLRAIPEDRRQWIERVGLGGKLDVDGRITPANLPQGVPHAQRPDFHYDLRLTLHQGTLWPTEGTFAVSDATGQMRLTPTKLTITELHGKRQTSDLSLSGSISWEQGEPSVALKARASELVLDTPLYALLPRDAQVAWDYVRPEGSVDAELHYVRHPDQRASYSLSISPRKLSIRPVPLPYRLDEVSGAVHITQDRVVLTDVRGRHGQAMLGVSGTAPSAATGVWDLKLIGNNVPIDDDLKQAVPAALRTFLESTRAAGTVDFDFSRLRLATRSRPTTAPTTTAPVERAVDADFDVKIRTQDASINIGLPLEQVQGEIALRGTTQDGTPATLSGQLHLSTVTLAGRPITELKTTLSKESVQTPLKIRDLSGKMADGELAGQAELIIPTGDEPARYALSLVMRNLDVRSLVGEEDRQIGGRLTASLVVEGVHDQPSSRRGRGDVVVSGNMYRIPLVLGLMQITNLALPITSPFNEGKAGYSIEGSRVTFENIELRAREMVMQGRGYLDFEAMKVRLTFTTENTTWPRLPVLGDLIQGARNEMLQIQVRGSLQEPKVSAKSMHTFTTTIDEVFRGEDRR